MSQLAREPAPTCACQARVYPTKPTLVLCLDPPVHPCKTGPSISRREATVGNTSSSRKAIVASFLALLDRVSNRSGWRVYGYTLLDNHYHLLVETPLTELSLGMQRLNGTYAQCFNAVHGLDGHLFQGRFYAGQVEADGHLLELTRYTALNPVRAGLCRKPSEWLWGSYMALLGHQRAERFLDVDAVLGLFSPHGARARRILSRFVGDGG
jgi:REP element-mobilizing transposase RayT